MKENFPAETSLWKGATISASIVAIITTLLISIVRGKPGLIGSALASVTVIIFFSVHLVVARISRNLSPVITMFVAMLSYFLKVVFMGAFLLLVTKFTNESTVDRPSFAICAILIIIAWLFGEIRSFLKLRLQLPLPNKKGLENDV